MKATTTTIELNDKIIITSWIWIWIRLPLKEIMAHLLSVKFFLSSDLFSVGRIFLLAECVQKPNRHFIIIIINNWCVTGRDIWHICDHIHTLHTTCTGIQYAAAWKESHFDQWFKFADTKLIWCWRCEIFAPG